MPSLLILIPLVGIMILNIPVYRNAMRRAAFWFALCVFITQILLAIRQHPIFWRSELEQLDSFFKVSLSIDQLSFVMLLCIGIVSLASLLVTRHTISDDDERFKFINLLMVTSIGMCGVVLVHDIFSLYVFLEITAIASFVLIAFEKDIRALEGAFKYMILSAIATMLMLSSIATLLFVSGGTSFSVIRAAVTASAASKTVIFAVGLFLSGLFIKGGLVPFHGWLPDAYEAAPSAVSVLLGGIITKVAGIYTLIRVLVSIFGLGAATQTVLLVVGTLSILVGAFAAIGQNNLKRMLAYSSISQVGYIALGLATGTPLGIAGAVFHLFNHAIFKSLLFVNSAAVESQVGTADMAKMGGISARMPVTGATSVIGILSAAGIPPLAGFWSKLIIVIALWQAGYRSYAVIAVVAGVVTLAYLLVMQRRVFFGKLREELQGIREAHAGIVIAAIMLAAITIGVGIFFPLVYGKLILPIGTIVTR